MNLLKGKILIFLFSLILLKPESLGRIFMLNQFFNYAKVVVLFVLLIYWLFNMKNSSAVIMIGMIYVVMLFSTIYHGGDIRGVIVDAASIIGIVLMGAIYSENIELLLDTWYVLFAFYISINFITVLAFPNGLYRIEGDMNPYFFLGHKNVCGRTISVMTGFMLYRTYLQQNRITKTMMFFVLVSYISIILFWSATSLVAFTIFIVLVLFFTKKDLPVNINIYLVMGLSLFLTIIFAILKMQNMFSFLIEDILQKNLTFTGRTFIWDRALDYIKMSPWFGWGNHNADIFRIRLGGAHTHNTWLGFLYTGGCISLLFFIAFLFSYGKKLNRYKSKADNILLFVLIFYSIFFITEIMPRNLEGLFYVVILINHNQINYQADQDSGKRGGMLENGK